MPFFAIRSSPDHPILSKPTILQQPSKKRTTNKIFRILKALANKTNYISILNTSHLTPFKSSDASEQFKNDQQKK